tara:strand:+ start:194 stop:724 length:531 start_codon:yes stop_codon:yes gene_type:complete
MLNIKLNHDPEHILASLEETEQIILSILYREKKALTIQQIRNQLVSRSLHFYSNFVDKGNEFKFSKTSIESESILYLYPFDSFFRLTTTERKNIQSIRDLTPKRFKENVTLPSFNKVKDRINNLINLKVVLFRGSIHKKQIGIYFLNPLMIEALDNRIASRVNIGDKISSGRYRKN